MDLTPEDIAPEGCAGVIFYSESDTHRCACKKFLTLHNSCVFCHNCFPGPVPQHMFLEHSRRHPQRRYYDCDECTQSFYTGDSLLKHHRRQHENAEVSSSISPFFNSEHYRSCNCDELQNSHITCRLCSRCISQNSIKGHMLSEHGRKCKDALYFACQECAQEFPYKSSYNLHMRHHHCDSPKKPPVPATADGENEVEVIEEASGDDDDTISNVSGKNDSDVQQSSPKEPCQTENVSRAHAQARRHRGRPRKFKKQESGKRFHCHVCNGAFKREEMRKHKWMKHRNIAYHCSPPEGYRMMPLSANETKFKNKWSCSTCGIWYYKPNTGASPGRRAGCTSDDEEREDKPPIYECRNCNFKHKHKSVVKRHRLKCNQKLKDIGSVPKAKNRGVAKRRKFRDGQDEADVSKTQFWNNCLICEKAFRSYAGLVTHYRRIHSDMDWNHYLEINKRYGSETENSPLKSTSSSSPSHKGGTTPVARRDSYTPENLQQLFDRLEKKTLENIQTRPLSAEVDTDMTSQTNAPSAEATSDECDSRRRKPDERELKRRGRQSNRKSLCQRRPKSSSSSSDENEDVPKRRKKQKYTHANNRRSSPRSTRRGKEIYRKQAPSSTDVSPREMMKTEPNFTHTAYGDDSPQPRYNQESHSPSAMSKEERALFEQFKLERMQQRFASTPASWRGRSVKDESEDPYWRQHGRTQVQTSDFKDDELWDEFSRRFHSCACGMLFRDRAYYFLHSTMHDQRRSLLCTFCDEQCTSAFDFISHTFEGHNDPAVRRQRQADCTDYGRENY